LTIQVHFFQLHPGIELGLINFFPNPLPAAEVWALPFDSTQRSSRARFSGIIPTIHFKSFTLPLHLQMPPEAKSARPDGRPVFRLPIEEIMV
jgi:hypothetical protein